MNIRHSIYLLMWESALETCCRQPDLKGIAHDKDKHSISSIINKLKHLSCLFILDDQSNIFTVEHNHEQITAPNSA